MSKDIKKSAEFNLVEVIVIILITGIVVSVTSGLLVFKNYDKLFNVGSDTSSEFSEFKKAYDHIVNSYVKEVDREKLINAAIDGMYSYLNDEYSIYMDKNTTESLEQRLDGEYTGVGIEIITNKDDGKIIINKVFSNSPASEAGLKVGDQLIALDGILLEGKENTYVSDTIKNSKNDTFRVKYLRNNKEYEITLKRKNVTIDSVVSEEYGNVGYIQIQTFSATTSKQVKNKINDFGSNIDSIVVDVRNNTGGYLSSAYEIADYFIAKGKPIYQLKNKNNIKIYFLANLDANEDNIESDMMKYSKSYDWPVTTTKEDVKRNINYILERNELLKEECKKYNFRLVNTSREDNRNKILNDLVEEAMKE